MFVIFFLEGLDWLYFLRGYVFDFFSKIIDDNFEIKFDFVWYFNIDIKEFYKVKEVFIILNKIDVFVLVIK